MASIDIQVDPKYVRSVQNDIEPCLTWGKFYAVRFIQNTLELEGNDSGCYHFEDDNENEVFIPKAFVVQSKEY